VEITKEEAKAYLEELADYELDEDQIERIAGGHHKNRDGMCEAALRGLKDISWGRLN
jgi:predicted DNA-binding protein